MEDEIAINQILDPNLTCYLCEKRFKRKKNLYEHLRNVHKVQPNISYNITCPTTSCEQSFRHYSHLREHLTSIHQIKLDCEKRTFSTKAGKQIFI